MAAYEEPAFVTTSRMVSLILGSTRITTFRPLPTFTIEMSSPRL